MVSDFIFYLRDNLKAYLRDAKTTNWCYQCGKFYAWGPKVHNLPEISSYAAGLVRAIDTLNSWAGNRGNASKTLQLLCFFFFFYFLSYIFFLLGGREWGRGGGGSEKCPLTGKLKRTMTTTATKTLQNKMFNKQNNSCARAL